MKHEFVFQASQIMEESGFDDNQEVILKPSVLPPYEKQNTPLIYVANSLTLKHISGFVTGKYYKVTIEPVEG
jgi:hypothetical protein